MARIAVSLSLAFLGTLAAVLLYLRPNPAPEPAATTAASSTATADPQLIERLDRLEQAIIQLGAQSKPDESTGPAVELMTPPLPKPQSEARQSAIQTGNDIVDQAVGAARWTERDAVALAAAASGLDGHDRAALNARVSAAINADQLAVDPAALRF